MFIKTISLGPEKVWLCGRILCPGRHLINALQVFAIVPVNPMFMEIVKQITAAKQVYSIVKQSVPQIIGTEE